MESTSGEDEVAEEQGAVEEPRGTELLTAEPAVTVTRTDPAHSGRAVDRLHPGVLRALTIAGFALPVANYFRMVHTYAVNVVILDQFDDVTVIRGSYSHFFDWHLLWAQHNETRIFFPNLIAVTLAHIDHFNIVDEDYLSACMLVAAVGLLIWAHRRRSPDVPLLYYSPVAFLLLSEVQWQNSLWGFQIAWYLTLLCLAATICLIDRIRLNAWTLAAAAAFGVIGSLSMVQGFLIWPIGLVLLYHRRRLRFAVPWLIVAGATAAIYFRNFDSKLGAPYPGYASQHLWSSLRFFVFAAGDIVGVQLPGTGPSNLNGYPLITVYGVVLLVVAAWVVAAFGVRRDSVTGSPIGVVLILTATMFALLVTKGRITYGFVGAGASRYTTFDLLFLCGIYLGLLGRNLGRARRPIAAVDGNMEQSAPDGPVPWLARKRTVVTAICAVVGGLIVLQASFGYFYGSRSAANYLVFERGERTLEVHAATAPPLQLASLYLFVHPAPWILHQLETLREHGLGIYAERHSSMPARRVGDSINFQSTDGSISRTTSLTGG